MTLTIIAAVSANDVIGKDNRLPWHLPADLKWFQRHTTGHHVIMGRKTFDEIRKPLPNRVNVVVTRNPGYAPEGVAIARSVDEAIAKAEAAGDDEIFVIGGAEIIAQTLHRADRLYLTRIHADFEGDTFFPEFDDVNEFHLVDREDFEPDEKNRWAFSFLTYERAGDGAKVVSPDEGG